LQIDRVALLLFIIAVSRNDAQLCWLEVCMCTTAGCMQVVTQMTQNQTAQNGNAAAHSTAAVVPAVTSVARLGNYATVAAFNTSERARVGFG
jgi:hypothetical protein